MNEHRLRSMSDRGMRCTCGFVAHIPKQRHGYEHNAVVVNTPHEAWETMAEHFDQMKKLEVIREGNEVVVIREGHELHKNIGIAKLVGMQTIWVHFAHKTENVLLKLEDVRNWAAREAAADAIDAFGSKFGTRP